MVNFKFNQILKEAIISPSIEHNTLSLYHGGRLDEAYNDSINHRKGRYEHGPGLYLTTNYYTAQTYSKGSRRLYMITIVKGNDAKDVKIPLQDMEEFIMRYCVRNKQKEVMMSLNKREVDAQIFINILINNDAVKSSDTGKLRSFLVNHKVDYSIVDNAFGWGERMIVLFNMNKIIDKKVVTPKDKLEVYDLPTDWN